MKVSLIIITGHPGSGKTSIATQLSRQFAIPLISKDALKERMFDSLGVKDKAWSLQVSGAAHRIMDDMVGELLTSGSSVIVESNFKAEVDSTRFSSIVAKYDVHCLQIVCTAPGHILFKRWNERIANSQRHEGHVEDVSLEQIRQDFLVPYPALDVPGKLIELDTTDFSKLIFPDLT